MMFTMTMMVLALLLLLSTTMPPAGAALAKKPHIIFNFADDLGHYNVGWTGNQEARTPHLDSLAGSGIKLSRAYTFKYCSPTRSSFLSGRLPYHVTQNNKNNDITNPGGADLRMELLPERLKRAGYRTAAVGKWHVGGRSRANLPINRGFDSHYGFLKGGEDHITQHSNDGGITFVDLWRDHAPAYGENGTFSTFMYAKEAVHVIEEHAARGRTEGGFEGKGGGVGEGEIPPLFMYLAWHSAHTPLEAPARFHRAVPDDDKAGTRAKMNALVSALDEGVANVTLALKKTGMWKDSLFVFMADNGVRKKRRPRRRTKIKITGSIYLKGVLSK